MGGSPMVFPKSADHGQAARATTALRSAFPLGVLASWRPWRKNLSLAPALLALVILALIALDRPAQGAPPRRPTVVEDKSPEAAYYKIITFPIPDDIVLECGGLEMLPDHKMAVGTRRGDIYIVDNIYDENPNHVKFTRWATGLHEVLGLAYNKDNGYLYAIQRGEVTRLKDTDNRGHANVYETVCDEWGLSGDYHEYAFMSKFDRDGNLWVLLTLTGSFTSEAPFRGWCLRITPDGKMIPTASGIRSPGSIAMNDKGEMFYAENQGPWNGGDALRFLDPGKFQGHPIGNKWYSLAPNMGPRPPDPTTNSRIYVEAEKNPLLVPPAIIQPYEKEGQSQSGIVFDNSAGKFGPFAGQFFSTDQSHSNMARYVLEKVGGVYQGACIPFRPGFASGPIPAIQGEDGSIFVGGSNRGWGSKGPKPYALERLVWTGNVPFEIHDMKLAKDGFDLTFTEPVDTASAANLENYKLSTFRYIYRADYGSPEVDPTTCTIKEAKVSDDRKSIHLVVDGLQKGAIHELHLPGLTNSQNQPLLHPVAYYTLWNFVDEKK